MSGAKTTSETSTVSERGNMTPTVQTDASASDHGHLSSVDENLAVAHGGRPATWHSRRFGHHAVNQLAAAAGSPTSLAQLYRRSRLVQAMALARAEPHALRSRFERLHEVLGRRVPLTVAVTDACGECNRRTV